MKMHEIVGTANDVAFQRLLERERLWPNEDQNVWTIGGACVVAEPARHRTGIPADATCLRYLVEHPVEGWTFAARVVWRSGKLFGPKAVHNVVERYWDDAERYGSDEAVSEAVNQWLRSV